jgi:hypothetical protein
MPDTDPALAEWRKITEAATPGPWNAETKHGRDIADEAWSEVRIKAPDGSDIASTYISHLLENYRSEEDETFIVTARTAIPRLLAAVDAALGLADEIDTHGRTRSPLARETAKMIRAAITTALAGAQLSEDENHG